MAIPRLLCVCATASVNIDLASLLFEFRQHVGSDAANDLIVFESGERDERVPAEEALQVVHARLGTAVGFHVVKGLAKHRQDGSHRLGIGRAEKTNCDWTRRVGA